MFQGALNSQKCKTKDGYVFSARGHENKELLFRELPLPELYASFEVLKNCQSISHHFLRFHSAHIDIKTVKYISCKIAPSVNGNRF